VSDDEVNEVAKDLFCPVCESTPLDVCPTQACADWRELIRTQLSEGKSNEEVHEYFARQYGDGVLADPPKRGFNLILWLFPLVAVVAGGALFLRYMRHLRQEGKEAPSVAVAASVVSTPVTAVPTSPSSPDQTDAKPDYVSQIEAELLDRK
jgi:cytochrome c-type biogenesis protein CcmH